MRIRLGKKTAQWGLEELQARMVNYREVMIDLGTGDGQFVYRHAAAHPDSFCIGLDAVGENMQEASSRTLRKPARGGLPNALFVVAGVESLPDELSGLADLITVNFPWGSLLKALVAPEPEILQSVARLAKPGARFIALLNYSVFKDPDYVERLGLPNLDEETVTLLLEPAYAAAAIRLTGYSRLRAEVPHRTTWGQHLILGSARETLMLEALINSEIRETR
ncbi:MAG TPA: class I SAM-dependent methyltransferase [Blastocatellia bacterium]|nr:class I SAM-dependent methyltransferase [Blastocatellia bacterium]